MANLALCNVKQKWKENQCRESSKYTEFWTNITQHYCFRFIQWHKTHGQFWHHALLWSRMEIKKIKPPKRKNPIHREFQTNINPRKATVPFKESKDKEEVSHLCLLPWNSKGVIVLLLLCCCCCYCCCVLLDDDSEWQSIVCAAATDEHK